MGFTSAFKGINPTFAVFLVKEKLRTTLIYNYSNEVNKTEGMNSDWLLKRNVGGGCGSLKDI
jgi:hypothetical protein